MFFKVSMHGDFHELKKIDMRNKRSKLVQSGADNRIWSSVTDSFVRRGENWNFDFLMLVPNLSFLLGFVTFASHCEVLELLMTC